MQGLETWPQALLTNALIGHLASILSRLASMGSGGSSPSQLSLAGISGPSAPCTVELTRSGGMPDGNHILVVLALRGGAPSGAVRGLSFLQGA
jgi:hypothetical protein